MLTAQLSGKNSDFLLTIAGNVWPSSALPSGCGAHIFCCCCHADILEMLSALLGCIFCLFVVAGEEKGTPGSLSLKRFSPLIATYAIL